MPENDFEIIVSVFPFAREIIWLPADDLEAHSVEVLNDLGIDPNVSMNLMELHANLPDLTDKAAVVVVMEKVRPLIKTNIQNQLKLVKCLILKPCYPIGQGLLLCALNINLKMEIVPNMFSQLSFFVTIISL